MFFGDIISGNENYFGDTTLYESVQHGDNVISNLGLTVDKIFSWFEYNNLKANVSKCHFFLSPYQQTSININRSVIKSSNCEKLLGFTINRDFTFNELNAMSKS